MKKYKPTTPGLRGMTLPLMRSLLTSTSPFKKLVSGRKRSKGRNNQGRITSRHRGGGHKRSWREVDFKYSKKDIPAKIETVEYDPNRTAFISLICFADGERRYILSPQGIKVGDKIVVSDNAEIKLGNRTQLKNIPVGTFVHAVEASPESGAKFGRSAGNSIQVIAHDKKYAYLKMPSTEVRKILAESFASIGNVSNEENRLRVIGKAGKNRQRGRRPVVRGSAMNPVDHPHGGGEGKAGRGRRVAVTKWGKPSGKGQKTRNPKKLSNKLIVSRRKVGKRR